MIDTADAEWEIEVRPLKSIDIQCVMIANIEMQPTACRLWLISAMSPDAARLTTSGFTCQGKRDMQIILLSVPTAIHVDFDSNSLYISFYIPHQSEL